MARLGIRRPVTRLGLLLEVPVQSRGDSGLFDRLASLAATAEDAGFDSLWVDDRVGDPQVGLDDSPWFEAYSLLGALAARTSRIRLGALPRGQDRRAPSMLAKIVTGIDVISHGRSVATFGSGLGRSALGGSPPGGAVSVASGDFVGGGSHGATGEGSQVDRLTEALRVCRAVLDEQEIEFSGTFYEIHGALNRPRPLQVGGVPLALFVEDGYPLRPEVLTAAVRYVDAVIIGGDATAVAETVKTVRAASLFHGRPADSVQVIWLATWPRTGPETGLDTADFEGPLSSRADGCILSVGSDASPESVGQAMLRLSAAMESMSLGHP